jgi:hypothetical protein
LANLGSQVVGENYIKAVVDVNNDVDELPSALAEANNTLDDGQGGDQYAYYVVDNAARPVFPRQYGIAIGEEVTLQASTSNVFTPKQNYIFQIDTSRLFEAPLEEGVVNASFGLIEWKPSIEMKNGTVYYWRITPERENPILGQVWNNSSFVYLPNSSDGWNQSHYYQYLDSENKGIKIDSNRNFSFNDKVTIIEIINGIYDATLFGYRVNLSTFSASIRPWNYQDQGIAITVLDPIKASHWINSGGDYGSINSSNGGARRTFSFRTETPEQRKLIIDFINDVVPSGHYVNFFSVIRNPDASLFLEEWESDMGLFGTTIFSVLENQGAELISLLKERGTVPYALSFIKDGGLIDEDIAETIFDSAKTYSEVRGKQTDGILNSIVIGPAIRWNKVIWQNTEQELDEEISLSIFKITREGSEELVIENTEEQEIDISEISAIDYPYLRIEYVAKDETKRTPPKLNFWRVLYDGLPEAIFNNEFPILFYNDTLNQGENFLFEATVSNLSEFSMDSLLVEYSITGDDNLKQQFFKRYPRVEKDDPVKIEFTHPTNDLEGNYQFTVELNPDDDQFEEYRFNNLGVNTFVVLQDRLNPTLDVTFDGIHIMDGDIVSSNPEIRITLDDENQFFLIDNPESFELKLDTGDANALLTVLPSDPSIEFIPGTTDNNKAEIIYRPSLKEAYYTLYVQGKDASNNFSGDNEYSINFRVIDRKSISNVFNYPNPFSTATQFVFTLTGEVPENMKLQIMTLSGKVVREIMKEELGDLRVGINRTDFWWDGTDEFGDKLGNGIYLYRLISKDLDGSDYEKFDTGQGSFNQDVFFKEGFGKMVIIR